MSWIYVNPAYTKVAKESFEKFSLGLKLEL